MTSRESDMRVLVVQNESASPGGLINEWFEEQKARVDVLRIDVEDEDVDPRDYQLIVPLGSEFAAYDESRAFVSGRHLGLQFHPEVTPEIMEGWVGTYRHELDDEGVDPDALLEETHRRAESSRTSSLRLLRRYIDAIARPGS